ncbi:MAG: acyl-CoA dehydrogenase C-terminal domain-containing protein [Gammaproteobacteria bacterium]|nr:acyl-CoA dehydrogenase C-terminal domain-containing protein [Gammaproteobacteria bacterium]
MAGYTPPLRDLHFVYHELHGLDDLAELPGYAEATPDIVDAVLEEAGRFCSEVLAPLNARGDAQGCRLAEDGSVKTPDGFGDAYARFVDAGWNALAAPVEHGGQGLPHTLDLMVQEMISSANMAFGMYPGLTEGAVNALLAHGSEAQRETYLGPLVAGRWAGTMCLTEPQAGTDLGLLRTRAEPRGDGSYAIEGTKIFISAGDHDLTENIVHLVLARLPDAPAGSAGISMFLVPKFLPGEDGSLGARNAVATGGLERKMGIHGSSTCVLNFDGATGWLVGEPHGGLPAMFTMMNAARIFVGVQGLGLAETAYQNAAAYARERLQGRVPGGVVAPERPADPIAAQPDVRRMLLTMRAWVEGGRALVAWVSRALDTAERHPDAGAREAADDLVALMTPIVKAFLTDLGSEVTNLGMQVYGGHGYVREQGMEQLVRDARITQIYEGTNGIQALDLVGRKLPTRFGRQLRRFFHPVQAYVDARADTVELAPYVAPLAKSLDRLQRASLWIAARGAADPNEAACAASEYLRLFGLVALGYQWARAAEVAHERLDGDETGFYRAKIATARFYMERLLPQAGSLLAAIASGGRGVMAFETERF